MLDSLRPEEVGNFVFVFNPRSVVFPDQYGDRPVEVRRNSISTIYEGHFERLSNHEMILASNITFNSAPFAKYILEYESA